MSKDDSWSEDNSIPAGDSQREQTEVNNDSLPAAEKRDDKAAPPASPAFPKPVSAEQTGDEGKDARPADTEDMDEARSSAGNSDDEIEEANIEKTRGEGKDAHLPDAENVDEAISNAGNSDDKIEEGDVGKKEEEGKDARPDDTGGVDEEIFSVENSEDEIEEADIEKTAKRPAVIVPAEVSRDQESVFEKDEQDNEDETSDTVKMPALKAPQRPEAARAEKEDDDAITHPEPVENKELTPRQEKALHYLKRKHSRQERIISQEEEARNGQENGHTSLTALEEVPTTLLPEVPTTLLPVANGNEPESGLFYGDGGGNGNGRAARALAFPVSGDGLAVRMPRSPRLQRKKRLLIRHLVRKHIRQTREDGERSSKRLWVTLISTAVALVVILVSVTAGGALFAYKFVNDTQSAYADRINGLRSLLPRDNLKMYDMNGNLVGQMMQSGLHTTVTYKQIAPDLFNATVATEDKDFWTNPGLDLTRTLQAALQDLQHGKVVGGGSTITQQLVKNLVLRNQAQDIMRKIQEMVLAPDLNNHYSKQDILEMYVNSNLYGEQAYGVDAAATMYFALEDQPDKPAAAQLDLAQSAMLAGIPNLPSLYDPWINREAALNRLSVVLESMVRNGYINRVQKVDAEKEARQPDFFKHPTSMTNRAPHFYDFVLQQLVQNTAITNQLLQDQTIKDQLAQDKCKTTNPLSQSDLCIGDLLARSGMKVYTTVDVNLQDKVLKIAQDQLAALSGHNATNAAEVMLDQHTGAIRVLLGSADYYDTANDGQFDVATQGYRQVGSSFKPYVYATAFTQGISPGQAVKDEPLTIVDPTTGSKYSPKDYDLMYHGDMTLRCALLNSLNVPAVKTIQHIGIDSVLDTMHKLDLTDYQGSPGYSTALGTLQFHLLDHVSSFGSFGNGGVHVPYYAIEKVVFTNTGQSWGHAQSQGTRVFSPQIAYMVTDVLSDYQQRVPQFGACNPLTLDPDIPHWNYTCAYNNLIPVAVKTGTTDQFQDVLTVGYSSDFVLGVWVGNNNNTPMDGINGIQGAAPIWHDAMILAMQGHQAKGFENPGGLHKVQQNYADGVSTVDWVLDGQAAPGQATTNNDNNNNNHNNNQQKSGNGYCPCYSFGGKGAAVAW